jgi:hypothetical protein
VLFLSAIQGIFLIAKLKTVFENNGDEAMTARTETTLRSPTMVPSAMPRPEEFARLCRIRLEFEQLITQLGRLRQSLQSGGHYLATPTSNPRLGYAYLGLIRQQY